MQAKRNTSTEQDATKGQRVSEVENSDVASAKLDILRRLEALYARAKSLRKLTLCLDPEMTTGPVLKLKDQVNDLADELADLRQECHQLGLGVAA